MNLRLPSTISLALVAAMAAMSVWAWAMLPAGTHLASHWGFDGKANGTMPKEMGLLLPSRHRARRHGAARAAAMAGTQTREPACRPQGVPRSVPRSPGCARRLPYADRAESAGICRRRSRHPYRPAAALDRGDGELSGQGALELLHRHPHAMDAFERPVLEKSHRLPGRLFVFGALITLAVRFAAGVEPAYLACRDDHGERLCRHREFLHLLETRSRADGVAFPSNFWSTVFSQNFLRKQFQG